MQVNHLIDAIFRQTTVLVAQLATAAGMRAPLAHLSGQVFADLVRELKSQGVGQKVIADMFGMSLRNYHERVQRLSESATQRGTSLWEAVLSYIGDAGPVDRARLLTRFHADDELTVRGVLRDLVSSGFVYRSGRGDGTTYRMAAPEERGVHAPEVEPALDALVWVAVHRNPGAARAQIQTAMPLGDEELDAALARLCADGRIRIEEDGEAHYFSDACILPVGDAAGWPAAIFDHYQAMVSALIVKLHAGRNRSAYADVVGGSTYSFELWDEHPHQAEVLGLLAEFRERVSELRGRVQDIAAPEPPPESTRRVYFYFGQAVIDDNEDAEGDTP